MRTILVGLAAASLAVALTGCPKTPVTSNPKPPAPAVAAPPEDDALTLKVARILRAADRRVVDDDLRALLSDADPAARAKAVLALGQIGDPSSTGDLAAAAGDSAPAVRAGAAFSMGLLANGTSLESLTGLAADPDAGVRAAAVEALGRLHDQASIPTIGKLLDDRSVPVRAAAALASWKFSEPEGLLDPLFACLRAPDARVRFAAAYAVARLTSAAVAPASSGAAVGKLSEARRSQARALLAAQVEDPDPEVRMQVARGLASPQGPAEFAVVGALSGDKDPGVRVNAVRSMGYPGVPIMPYLDRATTDRDFAVARAALEALGKVGGPMASEKLSTVILKLNGTWLREAALGSMIQVDPSKAQVVVEGLLINPDPIMRAAAAPMLVGRKESWAIHAVVSLLGDASPRVVVAAIPLVAEMDGPISKSLGGMFKAKDPVIRATCAEAVGSRFATPRSGVESRDDLYARLDDVWGASASDTIPDAKLAVVDASAKGGRDPLTRAILAHGLTDPDVIVRRRAALRLSDVYGEDHRNDVGPASDRPLDYYVGISRWARTRHQAVITMQRPGTATGEFALSLDAESSPLASWNFAELAGKKFFDGLIVHRVVPNFVVQDGDPRGDGYGGPGYSIRDEFNPLAYTEGTLGMASDGKDTAGSQWFVTLSAQPHLDGRYTSFGRVTRGFREVVTQIEPGDTVVSIRIQDGDGPEPLLRN